MSDTLSPRPGQAAKRLFIKTYGCQMNVYDSERMADVLRPLGYAATDTAETAETTETTENNENNEERSNA